MPEIIILSLSFLLVAAIYSSAGFGGGSSYLAILSLSTMAFQDVRMTALICNIIVVTSSVILFKKHQFINWSKVIPLIILSIPMAYIGGMWHLEEGVFYLILGCCLLVASLAMMIDKRTSELTIPAYGNAAIGGGIGFLSGLVGIGGGIFLSPLLHLSRWGKPKVIAATSAVFILFNSTAGILGQLMTNDVHLDFKKLSFLIIAVFIGSQIGVRMTILRFDPLWVKRITALVVFTVAIRLLYASLVT